MEGLTEALLAFIKAHQDWAVAVMLVTAFCESFAFLSLLFPGTALLIAAGTLVKAGTLPPLPVMAGAIVGAVAGDAVSYWIGVRFGGGVAKLWPFSRHHDLLPGGIRFFARHGGKSVFIGRFFGPIRAVIPLAAGIMQMPARRFWVANIVSALVWAPLLILVGDAIGRVGGRVIGAGNTVIAVFAALVLFGVAAVLWTLRRSLGRKG